MDPIEVKQNDSASISKTAAHSGDGEGRVAEENRDGSKLAWRPFIAAGLSLVFAGLGHLYLHQYGRGVIILVAAYFLFTLSDYSARSWMLNIVLFIFSAFDAFSFGKRGHGIV